MSDFENGGAFAIKGFNFQKAAITFIAIKNFNKPNFHILVEARDDFEVKFNGYDAYIQVKSQKLSLKKLLNSKDGKSILEKNLSNGDENSHFKIFVKSFAETDIKKMLSNSEGNICEPLYSFNDEQKQTILSKLNVSSDYESVEKKLLSSYIYKLPFEDRLVEAIPVLLGQMTLQEIEVSQKRGLVAINELFTLIDQKSEYVVESDEDYNKKKILKEDLQEIFKLSSTLDFFDSILSSTSYSVFGKKKIKQEQLKIIHTYTTEKEIAKLELRNIDILSMTEEELINLAMIKCNCNAIFNTLEEFTKKAIIIEVLAEMSEKI